jgi:hypothetical protein
MSTSGFDGNLLLSAWVGVQRSVDLCKQDIPFDIEARRRARKAIDGPPIVGIRRIPDW